MVKKIVAINASPRLGWNTDTLVTEAAKGAEAAGAAVEKFNLYRLEKFSGCISCFGCKREPNLGKCICRDGLTRVLDAIRESDGLILGAPNYLGNLSAAARALYERLIFQYLTYQTEQHSCNRRSIPVLFIMTSNAPDNAYAGLVADYKNTLSAFIGPTEVLVSGNTLQVSDYSKYNWTMFDSEAKKLRHETVFPKECEAAFAKGFDLAK